MKIESLNNMNCRFSIKSMMFVVLAISLVFGLNQYRVAAVKKKSQSFLQQLRENYVDSNSSKELIHELELEAKSRQISYDGLTIKEKVSYVNEIQQFSKRVFGTELEISVTSEIATQVLLPGQPKTKVVRKIEARFFSYPWNIGEKL